MNSYKIKVGAGGLRRTGSLISFVSENNIIGNIGYDKLVLANICCTFQVYIKVQNFQPTITRWVPHVEQELLTFPEHLCWSPAFNVDSCWSIFSLLCSVL